MSVVQERRKAREKRFHDCAFAAKKRRSVWRFYAQTDSIRDAFRKHVLAGSPQRILEIGCGLGTFAVSLAKTGKTISAIDISEYALKAAREKASAAHVNIDFAVMDAENMRYGDNQFDVVCGVSALHHLDLSKAIPEIRRVLRKGGKAVFIEPLAHNPLINLFRYSTPHLRSRDEQPLRMTDLEYVRSAFGQTEIKYYYLLTLFAMMLYWSPFHNAIQRELRRLDELLFSHMPVTQRYAWQVLIILQK